MKVVYSDGGREEAGFKGTAGDCVTRSIAIATGKPYKEVYNELGKLVKTDKKSKAKGKVSARDGVFRKVYDKYLKSLGWEWVPCMSIGSGCQVHLTDGELPEERLIVRLSRHLTTVIDGVIYDTHDPQRYGVIVEGGIQRPWHRCVYGYYRKED